MANLDAAKVVRDLRQILGLTQKDLSRRLNTTPGAVEHWEKGRHEPDMVRLFALLHICPKAHVRNDIELLIRRAQAKVMSHAVSAEDMESSANNVPVANHSMLVRENKRLRIKLAKVKAQLRRKIEQGRTLERAALDLQREMLELQALRLRTAAQQGFSQDVAFSFDEDRGTSALMPLVRERSPQI